MPILPLEFSITRLAATNEKEKKERQEGVDEEKRGDKRRPAEDAPHEEMDRGKPRRTSQALLAGLARQADRRVLNDVVAEIEGEPDCGHHKRTQNENRPA